MMPDDLTPLEPLVDALRKGETGPAHRPNQPEEQPESLRRARAFMAAAGELANLGYWEWDIAREKVRWSDRLYVIFGVDPIGIQPGFENFMERVHPEDRELVSGQIQRVFRKQQPVTLDYRIVTPVGSVVSLHSYIGLDADERGEPLRLWGVSQDVTVRIPPSQN